MAPTRGALAAAATTLLLGLGCSPSTYLRSRGADLLDAVPVSISHGWGIAISARATPFFNLGLGITPVRSTRYGFADRTFHGVWYEYEAGMPWSFWVESLEPVPPLPPGVSLWTVPLLYRWQQFRDAPSGEGVRAEYYEPNSQSWGRHPPITRESIGAFILPASYRYLEFRDMRREQDPEEVLGTLASPMRATFWESFREGRPAPRPWDLVELDAFAGIVGVRVGLRPVEFLDFVLGFIPFVDVMGDDLPDPVTFVPPGDGPANGPEAGAPAGDDEESEEPAPAAEGDAT